MKSKTQNLLFFVLIITFNISMFVCLRTSLKNNLNTKMMQQYGGTPITTLQSNQMALSPNGVYKLIMLSDGNLVLKSVAFLNNFAQDQILWMSGTNRTLSDPNLPFLVKMQTDGNFVINNNKNALVWDSKTSNIFGNGKAPFNLLLQDSGNLVLYDGTGTVKWATGTFQFDMGTAEVTILESNQVVYSPNGIYKVSMQTDGNLVLSSVANLNGRPNDFALWASGTNTTPNSNPNKATIQSDGNFVIYSKNNAMLWDSKTSNISGGPGKAPYKLLIQDDGNLVLYDRTAFPLWATNTFKLPSAPIANTATCSKTQLGFPGKCLGDSIASKITDMISGLSGNAKEVLGTLINPLTYALGNNLDMCMGDFDGNSLSSSNSLSNAGCGSSNLDPNYSYSVMGLAVGNVNCGTPQTIQACFVFDGCGTVYASLNGGTIQCVAAFGSGGTANMVAPLAGIINTIGFGFSMARRFTQTFNLAVRDGTSDVNIKEVTTRGHFSFNMGLQLPIDFPIGKFNLGDLINFNVDGNVFIDFGPAAKAASSMINMITHPNKKTFKKDLNAIMKSGAEISAVISGTFTLNFQQLTQGFFNDLSLNVASCSALITTGGLNTASNLPSGVYVYLTGSSLQNLADVISRVTGHFSSILKTMGINVPSNPRLGQGAFVALFIDSQYAGFKIKMNGFNLMCMYKYSNSSGSCNIGNAFFTALSQAGQMVIQKATKLFDKTGKELIKFSQDAENKISAASKKAIDDVKVVAQATKAQAEQVASQIQRNFQDFTNQTEKAAQQAQQAVQQAAQQAEQAAQRAAQQVQQAAQQAEQAAKSAAQKAAQSVKNKINKAKRFFRI